MKTNLLRFCLLGVLALSAQRAAWAQQCTNRVTHLSGTQLVGCTEITVTSEGQVGTQNVCPAYPIFPYFLGAAGTSSYTFTFDPPVSGVTLDVWGITNDDAGQEEMVMEVNGVPTEFNTGGISTPCQQALVLTGSGALQTCFPCDGSGRNINVPLTITTLTIENTFLSGTPGGSVFSLFFCSCNTCSTNAGTLTGGPLNPCVNDDATFPAATQTNLDGNDVLQYILFANPSDTLGSVLATAATPSFAFNPATMTPGVTYYVAAVAGDNQGGNVNPNDPCLDFSNALTLVWRPLPSVAFTPPQGPPCPSACVLIPTFFAGTPPFTLTYTVPSGGTQSFSTFNTATNLNICIPDSQPPGPLTIQATQLVDAFCTCF